MKIVDNSVSVTSQEGQLLSQRTGYFIFLLFLIITCLTGCSRTSSPERGVVIEQVDKNSGAEKTGLLAGDIVVGWSRGNVGGSISSPFDLAEIEIEENPRGTVVLEGLRDYHRKSWTLGRTEWGIGCRPVLTESLLLAYQESKKLAQKSEWAKATERLQTLAGHVKQSDLVWLRPWLLSRAAEWLAKSKDWAKVDAIYSEALDGASIAGPKVTSHILGVWGDLFGTRTDREDSAKAEQCYKRSLAELQRVASTSLSLAAIYNRLGHVLLDRGDPEQAAEFYGKALALREQLAPNSLAVAGSLNNLGNVALDRSAFREAEKFYRNALTIKQDLAPGTLDVAISLNNLGIAVVDQGDLTAGEQYIREALRIRQKLAPDSLDLSLSLHSLGKVAAQRGDLALAEEYYRKALEITQKLAPGSLGVSLTLNNLGVVASDLGDFVMAEGYYRQAKAIQDQVAPNSLFLALVLHNLGSTAKNRGDLTKAEEYYRQAMLIKQAQSPGSIDVATTLHNLGELARERRENAKAENYYRQALTIEEKLADSTIVHSETLYGLAATLLDRGQATRAIALFERAVNLMERQTSRLGGTDEVRAAFRARYGNYYREYLGTLIAKKHFETAFYVLERSRARTMLAMLAERGLVFADDLPLGVRLERQSSAAAYDRAQEEMSQLNTADTRRIQQLRARLGQLAAERDALRERVKQASPRLAALQYPQPLDLQSARAALDEGTTMLSYWVGPDRTVLFAIQPNGTNTGLTSYTLAAGEKDLRRQVEEFRQIIGRPNAPNRQEFEKRGQALFDLLIKPAVAQITTCQRLLIVPDGPLLTLPFAALLRDGRQYLVEWKPMHTIASATLYAELKKGRSEHRMPSLQIAAFGDPLYPKRDVKSINQLDNTGLRAAVKRGLDLTPLPSARDEVKEIVKLYSQGSEAFLGAQATEERAKSVFPHARYLHFAVHAFIDVDRPLDSGLVLAIPEKSAGRENGILQAWEIFEQVRTEADLVVLSACQSGLGKELGGEGLIGLVRALQYAGARSIVASLWNVDDLKTADLMKHFYSQLQRGSSKDEALRQAQLALLHTRSGLHPYYWAAFSLIGDWR